MKVNGYGIYPAEFIGIYKGVDSDIYSYYIQFERFKDKNIQAEPIERSEISSYIRSCNSRLEFLSDKGKWYSIYTDNVISVEDVTNPYLCRSTPIKYLLFGSIEERIRFAIQSRRYAVLNMDTYKSGKVVMTSTGFFKFQEYVEYVHKLNKLLSQPGSVISL